MEHDTSISQTKTAAFAGRQRYFQDMAHLVLQRRNRVHGKEKRDGGLILAVSIQGCVIGLCVLLIVILARTGVREVVQVVRVDQFGTEQVAIRLSELPATPEQLAIFTALMDWIERARIISPDGRIMNTLWKRQEEYTAQSLLNRLEPYREQQIQRQQSGIQVHITRPTVERTDSPRSFHAQWDECTTTPDGRIVLNQSAVWTATITVADFQSQAVKKARDLRVQHKNYRNLQGIVVEDVAWKPQPFLTLPIAEQRCAKS